MNKAYVPELIMLVGLPGSGKSTYAKSLTNFKIHSSDELRIEMFGDVNEHSKESNAKLFTELHKRIKDDLRNGNNVIYDATNVNRKNRLSFINELKNIPCFKMCVIILAPYHICLRNNRQRERFVPESAIKRMYTNFQPPHRSEGWDDIDIMFSCDKDDLSDFTLPILYNHVTGIDLFDQFNSHHSMTLGKHCKKAAEYILENYPENIILHLAALLHDEGKVFTQSFLNKKGINDGNCHYYQHHCVSAYNSYFYLYNMQLHIEDIIHASTLIYFHMHPHREWKDSEKIMNRDKALLGDKLFNEIMALHAADNFAH